VAIIRQRAYSPNPRGPDTGMNNNRALGVDTTANGS